MDLAFLNTNLTWNDDGVNIFSSGNVAFNNTLIGFGDSMNMRRTTAEAISPLPSTHYYRNDIRNSGDTAPKSITLFATIQHTTTVAPIA